MIAQAELSPHQGGIADGIIADFNNGAMKRSLAGLAGTGKTTVAKYLYEYWRSEGRNVQVLAPTGKAAMVLRTKGVPATTIHRGIYLFKGKYETVEGEVQLMFEDRDNGHFCDLLIIDEGSMVTHKQMSDIEGRGIPALWVGDPGQLQPVKSQATNLFSPASYTLREIHRQAADSPIIKWAYALRNGAALEDSFPGIRHLSVRGRGGAYIADACEMLDIDRVIVKTNIQRCALNAAIRKARGLTGSFTEGDEIVCLRNDRNLDVVNGQVFTVTKVGRYAPRVNAQLLDLFCPALGESTSLYVWDRQLGLPDTLDWDEVEPEIMVADYANAMTCHKFQGSSEERIGIIAKGYCGDTKTWNYTAATRAEQDITVFN